MKRLIGILLLGSALAACGGDDGTGIDPDKPITELSADERVILCEYIRSTNDPEVTAEAVCVTRGINAAEEDPSADCQMIVDDCLAASEPTQIDCSEAETESLADCPELTVGEYQECLDAFSEGLAETANLTCENSASELPPFPEEACAAAVEDCPELFGGASSRALSSSFDRFSDLAARCPGEDAPGREVDALDGAMRPLDLRVVEAEPPVVSSGRILSRRHR